MNDQYGTEGQRMKKPFTDPPKVPSRPEHPGSPHSGSPHRVRAPEGQCGGDGSRGLRSVPPGAPGGSLSVPRVGAQPPPSPTQPHYEREKRFQKS